MNYCVFCVKVIGENNGNSPDPVCKIGECCNECNRSIVLPSRLNPYFCDQKKKEHIASVLEYAKKCAKESGEKAKIVHEIYLKTMEQLKTLNSN